MQKPMDEEHVEHLRSHTLLRVLHSSRTFRQSHALVWRLPNSLPIALMHLHTISAGSTSFSPSFRSWKQRHGQADGRFVLVWHGRKIVLTVTATIRDLP
jgi:hypothetical protein